MSVAYSQPGAGEDKILATHFLARYQEASA